MPSEFVTRMYDFVAYFLILTSSHTPKARVVTFLYVAARYGVYIDVTWHCLSQPQGPTSLTNACLWTSPHVYNIVHITSHPD